MVARRQGPATVKASDARQNFAELVNNVHRTNKPVVIEKSGIAVAAIVSMADLDALQRSRDQRLRRLQPLEAIGALFADVDPRELDREADRAIRQVRTERARTKPRRRA